MLCEICRKGLEGAGDPKLTRRVGLYNEQWKVSGISATYESEAKRVLAMPAEGESVSGHDQEIQKYFFAHHPTKSSFWQSIVQGCVMCCRFSLNFEQQPETTFSDTGLFSVFTLNVTTDRTVMTVYFGNCSGGFALIPHDELDPDLNCNLGTSTEGKAAWEMASMWLNRCLHSHTACNNQVRNDSLPSRLIEIRSTDGERSFRVVEGTAIKPKTPYVCLSHCWGTGMLDMGMMLRKITSQSLSKFQPQSILPKTLQDTFEIAERLGVHYVWTDRLCIFQDNGEDWRRQVSLMHRIYGNAFLTVAALGARNDEEGCFFTREPDEVQATVVSLPVGHKNGPQKYRFELEKGWAWRLKFEGEPLTKRGWAIQERLLSPRVLHFGRYQVFWECTQDRCCELHPNGVDLLSTSANEPKTELAKAERTYTVGDQHLWKQLLGSAHRRQVEDPIQQLYVDWNSLIWQYSECQLTKSEDKLVAISGVAQDMQRRLRAMKCSDSSYAAGLWRQQFPSSLLWSVLGSGQRPAAYRAPSWSWAAVDAKVQMFNMPAGTNGNESLANLVSVTCTPKEKDETGELVGGAVTIKAPVAIATLTPPDFTFRRGYWKAIQQLRAIGATDGLRTKVRPENADGAGRVPRWEVLFDVAEETCDEAHCLPIEAHAHAGVWAVQGLVLRVTQGGRYTRIGRMSIYVESHEAAIASFEGFPEIESIIE